MVALSGLITPKSLALRQWRPSPIMSSPPLQLSGVRRVYGLPGDSLNGFTDAIRRSGEITWEHVRHEETAAFAAAADAALTGSWRSARAVAVRATCT